MVGIYGRNLQILHLTRHLHKDPTKGHHERVGERPEASGFDPGRWDGGIIASGDNRNRPAALAIRPPVGGFQTPAGPRRHVAKWPLQNSTRIVVGGETVVCKFSNASGDLA